MKRQIEASEDCFTGVAELDRSYCLNEIDWYETDRDGDERRVKLWDVPTDIRHAIQRKLITEACQMEEDSRKPDPMDVAHDYRENHNEKGEAL